MGKGILGGWCSRRIGLWIPCLSPIFPSGAHFAKQGCYMNGCYCTPANIHVESQNTHHKPLPSVKMMEAADARALLS